MTEFKMTEFKREDLVGTYVDATFKPMNSGEQRLRMRPKGLDLSTRSLHLTLATQESAGWQGGHLHHSGIESYHRIKGVFGWVSRLPNGVTRHGIIWAECEHVSFEPEATHDIFTSAGAEFVTWQVQVGEMTPNKNRSGDDWWPADELFNPDVLTLRAEVERMVNEQSKDI